MKLFLSHLTVESKLAEILKKHLDEDFIGLLNIFVSSDRTSIPVGSKWFEELINAIEGSNMHLILSSPESIKRPWIHFEAGAARILKIPIVPLCHSGLQTVQLPVPLSEGQGILLSEPEGIHSLYSSIAKELGSKIPNVHFEGYSKEVIRLEKQFSQTHDDTTRLSTNVNDQTVINNPSVVCVTSQQFDELGLTNQIELVLKAFPQDIEHNRLKTSVELRELLMGKKVDIVHIAAFVCPRTGDLYFSDIDLDTGLGNSSSPDVLQADEFAELLKMSGTLLVVVGGSESLVLAAILLPFTNIVATRDMVSPKMLAKWIEVFYGALKQKNLSAAFNLAIKASSAPMRLYAKTEMIISNEHS